MIGPTYYGTLDTANTGPTGGRLTPAADAVSYSMLDLDESGTTDAGDLALLLLNYGGRTPGDIDGDGIVGSGDLALLLLNF
mgnify:CR=1 FL=1